MGNVPLLLTIDGMDGAGKTTTTHALIETLLSEGLRVKHFQFPHYKSPAGSFVWNLQNAQYGVAEQSQRILDNPVIGAIPYTMDRLLYYSDQNVQWEHLKDNYDILLFDRNYTCNWLFHASKIVGTAKSLEDMQADYYWLHDWISTMYFLEIESTWIRDAVNDSAPILNIFLHGDPKILNHNLLQREHGDLDLNERRLDVQARVEAFGSSQFSTDLRRLCIQHDRYSYRTQTNAFLEWANVCTLTPLRVTYSEGVEMMRTDVQVREIRIAMEQSLNEWREMGQ